MILRVTSSMRVISTRIFAALLWGITTTLTVGPAKCDQPIGGPHQLSGSYSSAQVAVIAMNELQYVQLANKALTANEFKFFSLVELNQSFYVRFLQQDPREPMSERPSRSIEDAERELEAYLERTKDLYEVHIEINAETKKIVSTRICQRPQCARLSQQAMMRAKYGFPPQQ
jgi:hypothetical protein